MLLDPSTPLLINHTDFSSYTNEVTITFETDYPLLSFSASILSIQNCHKLSNGLYAINDDYITEMQQFGNSFLLFDSADFISALVNEFERTQCSFEFHPLTYLDKNNHRLIHEYFDQVSDERSELSPLFLKDTANSYSLQTEWRFILLDIHNHYSAKGEIGANVKTGFLTQVPVMEVTSLSTLRCSEDFLLIDLTDETYRLTNRT